MSRDERRVELRSFLQTIQPDDRQIDGAGDHDDLLECGYLDSLAIVEIVLHLETDYRVDFGATGIDPNDLTSIAKILDVIDRLAPN